MAEEYGELAACDWCGYVFASLSPQEGPVRPWAMEEANGAIPGVGAVGDNTGLLCAEHPHGASLPSLSPVPGERKEGKGARRSGQSLNAFHSVSSQLISRASSSGVEYYWDQLNETVFTVHSSSRSSERPG